MDWILELNTSVNSIVWGPPMMVVLVGAGIILTIATRGVQFRRFGFAVKQILGRHGSAAGDGTVGPFQALATSLSSTVGVGNIVGVSIAVASGGPGAVLWMILTGLLGMATMFAEIAIAMEYREKDDTGIMHGGAMYVLKKRYGLGWLGALFAGFCALAAFGIGNMAQSNTVATAMQATYGVPEWQTGAILAALTALVVLGGIRRIAEVASVLVPVMCGLYVIAAAYVLLANLSALPGVVELIVDSAFNGQAALGGFAGATVRGALREGIARALFSNEAGMGSAPMVHAAAVTDHPVRQATYGIVGVFVDTAIICTLTAGAVLATGAWTSGLTGAELTSQAFAVGLPGDWGRHFITLALVPFGFSTTIGWAFYGETGFNYLFGTRSNLPYRLAWVVAVYVGAVGGLEAIWQISDTLNALMAVPNLIAVLGAVRFVRSKMREFFAEHG